MNHHAVAAASLAGICLDVLGGLYLAYDLLGGRNGPLRLLTRMVTYALVFGIGYGLGLGLFFGLLCGAATGITVAIELQRVAHGRDHYPLWCETLFSALRASAFGAALYPYWGLRFAAAFTTMLTLGQAAAYFRGMRPGLDYSNSRRPRLTRRHVRGTILRTIGYTAAAVISGSLSQHLAGVWGYSLRLGLVSGVVTAVGITVNPFIEYYADNLPERRLGAFGICLVLCGFALQSLQYWLAILDVKVT